MLPLPLLEALQSAVSELGAETYPLFLRLGGTLKAQMQPVTSRALLAEVEQFSPLLTDLRVPCLLFRSANGSELGGIYGQVVGGDGLLLAPTAEGIRLVVQQFPPPVGFRSRPAMGSGQYECYFEQIERSPSGDQGIRTAAMGGSGAPVPLPALPIPPVTRWDFARTAGKPAIGLVSSAAIPALEVYKDLLHGLASACTESLRLKVPLQMRRD